MKQFFGLSQRGDLKEAVRGLGNPQLIMLFSNSGQFETHVKDVCVCVCVCVCASTLGGQNLSDP